jgi:formylglycine-generating enzyme required for sulfatase activity
MKSIARLQFVLIAAAILFGATAAHTESNELLVSHVQAAIDPQTASVDVWYRLETVDGVPVTVSLYLSTDSGTTFPYLCQTVSGDIGVGVLPGIGKHILWNARADLPGFSIATCRLRVTANDGYADFVSIPPGTFMMGSPVDELSRGLDEAQHQVTLTHGFRVQATEVTNKQYRDMAQWAYDHGYVTAFPAAIRDNLDGSTTSLMFMGAGLNEITFSNGVFGCSNPDSPVRNILWVGAAAYCDWLSLQQGLPRAYNHSTWQCNAGSPYTTAGYRLPTEAEWEYSCRAGATTAFANGPISQAGCSPTDPNLDLMGWYCGNAGGVPHPVAGKMPNAWNLYDMHGNLYEWCNDWYGAYDGTATDPVGSEPGPYLVFRSACYGNGAATCRSAERNWGQMDTAYPHVGFRPVRSSDSGVLRTGTITVDPEPNRITVPWRLVGPATFIESVGDTTLSDMTVGSYTVTWGAVDGYVAPSAVTDILVADQTLVFIGSYTQIGLPFPDTADKLMANFQTIYEWMDYYAYVDLVHPDYVTILQQSTINEFPDVGATLDEFEERRIHERMYSHQDVMDPLGHLVPGIQSIQFQTFARQGTWAVSPAGDPIPNAEYALYDVAFLFDRGGQYSTLKVQGAIKFYVTHRDSLFNGEMLPYYQMLGQVDLTLDQKSAETGVRAIENVAWGSVKALFR